MIYLKRLGYQELGSPDSEGRVQRGRYILISKQHSGVFPNLSTTIKNDTFLLPIRVSRSSKLILCSYVYHNDKYHFSSASNPRDEYRLYLNNTISDELDFAPGNIAVFKKIEGDNNNAISIDVIKKDSKDYRHYDEAIIKSNLRGGHGISNIALGKRQFEDSVSANNQIIIPYEVQKQTSKFLGSLTAQEIQLGAQLFKRAGFRDWILTLYNNKCAITGEVIKAGEFINLEAAHIKPEAHNGTHLPSNGIALSRDLHWAFDKGLFTLSNDYRVIVHEGVKNSFLNSFNSKRISTPEIKIYQPHVSYVEYHRNEIYGLFETSGSIRRIQ